MAAACSAGPEHVAWAPASVPGPGTPDIGAALAGDPLHPWLLAGATVAPSGAREVALWSAKGARGEWARSPTATVSADGPQDAITGVARAGALTVGFGWRPSPIHGIPRPSPWTAGPTAASWQEVATLRELFGGENVIALGGLTGGPHGFSIAGTWVNAANRAVATVWRSPDGAHWQRNDSDPALGGAPGELTSAYDVADAGQGLAAVGAALAPTPSDPTAERGALWESAEGSTWQRVDAGDPSLSGGHGAQVRVDHVAPLGGGWVAVGSRATSTGSTVVVWAWGAGRPLRSTALRVGGQVSATALAVSGTTVVVAAVAGGRLAVWASDATPAGLRRLTAPSGGGTARSVVLAAAGGQLLVASGPRAWWADLP